MAKQRADQLLVDRGLAESRTRAQALILAGLAFVGDRKIDKAGQQIADDAQSPRNLANRAQMLLDLITASGKAS